MKLRVCLLILTMLLILAAGPVALAKFARVNRSDIVATRMYLEDRHELARAEAHDRLAAKSSVEALVAHVRGACPNVLAGAPGTKVIDDLRIQTLAQLSHADGEPSRNAVIRFAKRVERLRWSNHKLTYYVRGGAEEAIANAEMVTPDICMEARGIVAGGYQRTPAIMAEYERREMAANSKVTIVVGSKATASEGLEELILQMLRRYERPDEKSLLLHRPTAMQQARALTQFLAYGGEIVTALGLPVRSPSTEPANVPSHAVVLQITPPAWVRRAGGRRLRTFYRGRMVASMSGCAACHRIGDSGNKGPGVTLTHIGDRLNAAEIREVIATGGKPPMPSFRRMPARKLDALVRFLAMLRQGPRYHGENVDPSRGAKTRRGDRTGRKVSRVYAEPSGAMEPTLPVGTRIIVGVNKSPAIGEIVVVHPSTGGLDHGMCGPRSHVVKAGGKLCAVSLPTESRLVTVKRVVAGPGDEIYVHAGHVYRKAKGARKFTREADEYASPCGGKPMCNYPVPIKIAPGHWFLMGDNRGASLDSRAWGPVPAGWIVGVASALECRLIGRHRVRWVRRGWRRGCADVGQGFARPRR